MSDTDLFLFVSHVAEDRHAALEIVGELEGRGVKCWIAPRDVRAGRRFDDEIADAIDACRAMLLVFSDQCNESEYIHREITVAGESHKVIIPFRIEDAQPKRGLRVRLSDLHWIDGFISRERAIDELARALDQSPTAWKPQEGDQRHGDAEQAAKPAIRRQSDGAPFRFDKARSLVWNTKLWIVGGAILMAAFIVCGLSDEHSKGSQAKWATDIGIAILLMAISPILGIVLKYLFRLLFFISVIPVGFARKRPMEACGAAIGSAFVIYGICDDYQNEIHESWVLYVFLLFMLTLIGFMLGFIVKISRNAILRASPDISPGSVHRGSE